MIIVRALDATGDFTFGAGLNNYKQNLLAVAQDIQMNLMSFVGDCFFATSARIDWWNLLGGKNQGAITLAVNTTILNTTGVTGIIQTSINLTDGRELLIQYSVNTVYTTLQGTFSYDLGVS